MHKEDQRLEMIFRVNPVLVIEKDENGVITICEKQDHPIQRFFRKIKIRVPEYKKTSLDEFGSFVFDQIDGVCDVGEIGSRLETAFGEEAHPVYERLLLFLNFIDEKCHYIERVK